MLDQCKKLEITEYPSAKAEAFVETENGEDLVAVSYEDSDN